MENKILYNPVKREVVFERPDGSKYSEIKDSADVIDYPISEAVLDPTGNPMWDDAMGTYRTTGRTLEFSLRKGEAGSFPDYVADILLDRYGFLEDKTGKVGKTVKAALKAEPKVPENAPDKLTEETDLNESDTVPDESDTNWPPNSDFDVTPDPVNNTFVVTPRIIKTEAGYKCQDCGKIGARKSGMLMHHVHAHQPNLVAE